MSTTRLRAAPVSLDAGGLAVRAGSETRRSVWDWVTAQARERPDAPAIGAPGRVPLTYAGLERAVARTMDRLTATGAGPGAPVALVLPEGPELAVACLGAAAGAVAAPLDPDAATPELARSLDALDARVVIVPAGSGQAARQAALARGIEVLELAPTLSAPAGAFALEGAGRGDGLPSGPDDPALVLRTSGTTGSPKTVSFVHGQLATAAGHVVAALTLTDRDRSLALMPFFHGHGLIAGLLAPLTAGALVTCPGRFSALHAPAWLEETRPTWYTAVPAMHRAILDRVAPGAPGIGALRFVRSASAPLHAPLMAALEARLAVPVIEAYGMTEAAHQIASNPLPPRARKPGSVGLPMGFELRIVDDAGAPLPPARVGGIELRGPTVGRCLARPGEWLRTGDVGYLDPDGYLFLLGRRDDMINRGGEKMAPGEVEAVLLEHPAVADAVALPQVDRQLGEVVSGLVALRAPGAVTPAALRAFAATRLGPARVPCRIIVVPEIPREPTGKVARRRLAASFGLDRATEPALRADGDSPELRLMAFVAERLAERDEGSAPALAEDTSLVRSGLFDSLALVELAAWVEEESGGALAPLEAARLAACDTIGEFAAFARDRGDGRTRAGRRMAARAPRPTPAAAYRFTAYRSEHHAQVLDLQTHHWGADRVVGARYFEWKYERNPYRREPLIHLAWRDGEVVAMRGYFGARWEAGRPGNAFDVPCAGDLVVAPAHRARGLVAELMAFAHADLTARGQTLAFNLSSGRATFHASLRAGWRPTPSVEPLHRRAEAGSGSGTGADPFAALDRAGGPAGALEIAATPRPEDMAAVVARAPYDGRVRHVRDSRYFAWRFGNPLSRYRFLFWHGRGVEGYLVLRAPAPPREGAVTVADWEGDTPQVRAALLEAALERGRFPNVRTWGAALDVSARDVVERHGFRPRTEASGRPPPHATAVLVRAFGPARRGAWALARRRLLDLTSWDLRPLYSDGV